MVDEAWLALVRIARDSGDISSLFPPGINNLRDLPFTHTNLILNALSFLKFPELPEEEQPPKHIWLDGERMEKWWNEVDRVRKAKQEGHGDQSQMSKNALADQLLAGVNRPDGA